MKKMLDSFCGMGSITNKERIEMSAALVTLTGKVHVATGGYLFRTVNKKTRYLHIDAAELALGKPLPKGAEVHHVNGYPADNRNSNLVVCPDHKYHSLLHMREEAMSVTGNPNLRLCSICQIFDRPERMKPHGHQLYHPKCLALQSRKRRAKIKKEAQK